MIKIHSTKKLLAKLPLNEGGMLPEGKENPDVASSLSPLGEWHANLLTLQGQNCILFVHDATRFPVFIKELSKADFARLGWHFEDCFMNTLLKAGAQDELMQAAAKNLGPLQFDNECNRSVQGTMNQMAGDIEHTLMHNNFSLEDIGAYRTGAWLADRPCKIKGVKDHIRPDKAMLALLEELATGLEGDPESAPKQDYEEHQNVVSLDKYRK